MPRCLLYSSEPAETTSDSALLALAAQARTNNQALGITSRLVRTDHHFVQAIEGDIDAVNTVFARICADSRHRSIVVALDAPMVSTFFPGMSMDVVTRAELPDGEYARLNDAVQQTRHPKADLWIDGWRLLEPLAGIRAPVANDTHAPGLRDAPALRVVDGMLNQVRRIAVESGPQAVTIETVAKATGLAPRTALRYFPTPAALIGAAVKQTVVRQFRQFQLRLEQMRFANDIDLAGFVATHVTRTYLSDRAIPSAIQLFALRNYHQINYEGFGAIAREIAAAMARGGMDTSDAMLETKLTAGLAGIAAAMKATALTDRSLLPTAEFASTIAGLFLGALRGIPIAANDGVKATEREGSALDPPTA